MQAEYVSVGVFALLARVGERPMEVLPPSPLWSRGRSVGALVVLPPSLVAERPVKAARFPRLVGGAPLSLPLVG